MTKLLVKRIYDDVASGDGHRVLVDRLWPRGVAKADAGLDDWAKEIAPSDELRKRFHADDDYAAFERDYRAELDESKAARQVAERMREHATVTLLTAAKDPGRSHVSVLLDWLD